MRFREFPDIEVPRAALAMGLVPNDWGNDASPRMSLREELESDAADEYGIALWCGNEQTKQETGTIFLVTLGQNVVLYDGDSLSLALSVVDAYIRARQLPPLTGLKRRGTR